jgi:hypothetical protein
MEGVLGADFSVKHHWNLSQKLLELDSGNKLHQIIAKTLVGKWFKFDRRRLFIGHLTQTR